MRASVRGQRSRGRGVSEAQTGGVGGAENRTDGAQRRRGGPRQISQRKLRILSLVKLMLRKMMVKPACPGPVTGYIHVVFFFKSIPL